MKFKVGDKVRLVKTDDEIEAYKNYIGKTFTIKGIRKEDGEYFADLAETYDIIPYLKNLKLVNKEYTYEDLKKSPVGTKVTFEDGTVLVKDNSQTFENDSYTRDLLDLENFESRILGQIIKIEEPEYNTVYETKKEEILDEVEKRYLSNFIRPFRDKVERIEKVKTYDPMEYIQILINTDEEINLPSFEVGEMYKGMKANKRYELEELGL